MSSSTTQVELAVCRSVTVVHGRGEAAVTALRDVDLSIGPGERTGLVGRSGSGKTTLLHVLGGLVSPTSGEVLLGGSPLSSLDAAARGRARARSIAYVFQGAQLLPTFTAFENVAFADHLGESHHEVGPAALLEVVGLGNKLDSLPAELSGGEAQRVAIARALVQQPDLLLCDEPTGQLDSDTGTRVLDLIDALHARLGFALVIATHDPEVAARADRIVTLDDGRIVADERLE
ncbi:MAG: ABC transporter ATP-binding protein [Actinomycetota bacterium]|nr:ABC transporter ATP-binding protein [Actinomycetota bacterium]